MEKEFYRFRSISNLTGSRQELEKQTIFFAAPDTLNDPMEGFRDIFWKGGYIIWRNLFQHYILCLERLCSMLVLSGEDHPISKDNMPIFSGEEDFPTPIYKELFDQISNTFLGNNKIDALIHAIAGRTTKIRRDELHFYLSSIHQYALETIYSVYEEKSLIPVRENKSSNAEKPVSDSFKSCSH